MHYNERNGWKHMFWDEAAAEALVQKVDPGFMEVGVRASAALCILISSQVMHIYSDMCSCLRPIRPTFTSPMPSGTIS